MVNGMTPLLYRPKTVPVKFSTEEYMVLEWLELLS